MEETKATPLAHPRRLGWIGTTAIAMGGSNQSIFLMGVLLVGQGDIPGQGSAAILLLVLGVILSWAAAPGWTELALMFPNRVGGITATCAEAFKPYSEVLANLTGTLYWWGWVPACGISALLSATAIHQWYLPWFPINWLATLIILMFTIINLYGIYLTSQVAIVIASISAGLALISGFAPIIAGTVDWTQATTFHLTSPFKGVFGDITSLMAGLYLIGFAAPAFEQATCHVGETVNPDKNIPRAIFASAVMAGLYFILLPIVWLGVIGSDLLAGDLGQTLGPTFAPVFGATAKAAAIWFLALNMFHDTLAPLSGATRTLMQLAEDGLLPRILAKRTSTDAPLVSTLLMFAAAVLFLWIGEPLWIIAAANFTYLLSICLVSIAVWLLRKDQPNLKRPYRAPRGTIGLGLVAALIWAASIVLGFEQFGLPTIITAICFAYAGSILYAWRKMSDRRLKGLPFFKHTLHVKLTGAMILVLILDGIGYLIAVQHVPKTQQVLIAILSDIFVVIAILTIALGLVLPGMIAHSVLQVTNATKKLVAGTMADFSRAMLALGKGDLDAAKVKMDMVKLVSHSNDEISEMTESFNILQEEIKNSATGLVSARAGLLAARNELVQLNTNLEQRVIERTHELNKAHQELLSTARKAGMAEVAINVLHNIGNVLNSVNVSVYFVKDQINNSKINHIVNLGHLMEEKKDDLVNFITQNKQGKAIPEYINQLAIYWQREKTELMTELNGLAEKIEHIKNIVATQQSLSGTSALEEVVVISELFEEALKIGPKYDVLYKQIDVQKNYEKIKPVWINKIKLLQILINLIVNSVDALTASPNDIKVLELRISHPKPDFFAIEVIDNGIGINKEIITKIFMHGFTTKQNGHGFGLHACALAAKEMDGSLQVYSAGKNQGAHFILELPYKTSENVADQH